MASDFIGLNVIEDPEIAATMATLSNPTAYGQALEKANEYLVDVLKEYPSQAYVSRLRAYPETGNGFFTQKQQRYFFWALKEGKISTPYNRSQTLRNNWTQYGEGLNQIVANETPYAALMMGDGEQGRMAKLGGWKTVNVIVKERRGRMMERFEGALKRIARRLK